MPIYRSKYDPYDVDRKQPYDTINVGGVRVRIWKNETYQGIIWKFDVVGVRPRSNSDEISRGIPFEEARNAAECLQKFVEWMAERHVPRSKSRSQSRQPERLSAADFDGLPKPDGKRR